MSQEWNCDDLILKLPAGIKGKFTHINLTTHAQDRMLERNISQSNVLEVLRKPHGSVPCDDPRRSRNYINQGNDEIHVVWEPEPGYPHRLAVITVFRKQKKQRHKGRNKRR